jgi:mannitol-1-/sugar-/sorbitol-6-/2-deoxyglucose-6-phosphatase
MIEAVIFDMDGVLIDSEPLWKKAEQKIFKTVGIELNDELCRKTTGLDNSSTVNFWYSQKPWTTKSIAEVADEISAEVLSLFLSDNFIKQGVENLIGFFVSKKLPLAVASSSEMKFINTVLEKLKLKDKFAAVYSSEYEDYGKPHPGVYISTARRLDKKPENCLAFEDSFYGALAAKAARMRVVSVLDEKDFVNTKFDFTDLKIKSFNDFTEKEFDFLSGL